MSNLYFSNAKWFCRNDSLFYFMKLDVTVMSIELTGQKSRKHFLGRKIKMNLSSCCYDFKAKKGMNFFLPDLPPGSHMFDSMMKCWEHFARNKNSFFIRTINRDFIRDVMMFMWHLLLLSIIPNFSLFSKDFLLPFFFLSLYFAICSVKIRKLYIIFPILSIEENPHLRRYW